MEVSMAIRRVGVLPIQELRGLLAPEWIDGISADFLNPASIDVPISAQVYRLTGTFIPGRGRTVEALLRTGEIPNSKFSLDYPLEVGVEYLIKAQASFCLPSHVYAYANPKSSTGRINLSVGLLADKMSLRDALEAGFQGDVWYLVRADSFPVKLTAGQALSQLRFFNHHTVMDAEDMEIAYKKQPFLYVKTGQACVYKEVAVEQSGSLYFTLDLGEECAGWEALHTNRVLDYAGRAHRPEDFFRPVMVEKRPGGHRWLPLQKGRFFILSTTEWLRVPPQFSVELRSNDERMGHFHTHRAGYVDPGWGWGEAGERKGQPITLEVIAHENLEIRTGQPVARFRVERMREVPDVAYQRGSSNYTDQILARLSKHFLPVAV